MVAKSDDRSKQAYAYGSSIALAELGFDGDEAREVATKLASEAIAPSDARVKEAYAIGVAQAMQDAGVTPQE